MTISLPIFFTLIVVAGIIGFFFCAILTSGAMADLKNECMFYKQCAENNETLKTLEHTLQQHKGVTDENHN